MPNPANDRPFTVLVVDDVADTADSLAVLFELHGFRVLTARDGLAALRVAATDPPDVVVTDLMMPGMTGWELTRRLRGQAAGRPLFVIAVSGLGRPADRCQSAEAGVDLHLVKPADPAE